MDNINNNNSTPLFPSLNPSVANSRKPSLNSSILNGEMMDIFRSRACSTVDRVRSRASSYDIYHIASSTPNPTKEMRRLRRNRNTTPSELDIVNECEYNTPIKKKNNDKFDFDDDKSPDAKIAKHIYITSPTFDPLNKKPKSKIPVFITRSTSMALPSKKNTSLHMSISNNMLSSIDL